MWWAGHVLQVSMGFKEVSFLISSGERERGQDFDLWVLSRIFFWL